MKQVCPDCRVELLTHKTLKETIWLGKCPKCLKWVRKPKQEATHE